MSYPTKEQIAKVQASIQTKIFINNEFVESASKKTFETLNPSTGELLAKVCEADKADVDKAVIAARAAFEQWKFTDGRARSRLINKLADLLEEQQTEFAILETLDNGKPFAETSNVDIPMCISNLRYYAGWADKISGKTCPVAGDMFAWAQHEPVGVCGQIVPWNFPLLMAIWKLGPCLATGCVSVLKPAEQTPLTALKFAELVVKAGFPPGVLSVLPGFGETAGAAISEHMDIDKVAFTGSTSVGRTIMGAAAKSNLKKVSLELGGKSPLIIAEDCKLDNAVAAALVGVFFNQGQVCTASSRIFVHESIHDAFVEKVRQHLSAKKQGDPFTAENSIGPLVSDVQQKTVQSFIEKGHAEGAKCLVGISSTTGTCGTHPSNGYFITPTVFTDVKDDMTIAKEEIFGPVMSIMTYKTIDEAIARANKTHYGLAAGVFTESMDTAFKCANQIKAGTVWINTYNSFDHTCPFGGFKESGIGRELGEYALALYTEVKTVMIKLDSHPLGK